MANLKLASVNEIKIDKGVPVPRDRVGQKYPLHEMEIGDSFLVPVDDRQIHQNLSKFGKYHGKRFMTRLVPEGRRVWRIA